jgi:hypothetical protein
VRSCLISKRRIRGWSQTGNEHERTTLGEFRASTLGLVEIGAVGVEETPHYSGLARLSVHETY